MPAANKLHVRLQHVFHPLFNLVGFLSQQTDTVPTYVGVYELKPYTGCNKNCCSEPNGPLQIVWELHFSDGRASCYAARKAGLRNPDCKGYASFSHIHLLPTGQNKPDTARIDLADSGKVLIV